MNFFIHHIGRLHSFLSNVGFPKTVKVAVSIYFNRFFVVKSENGFGCFAGRKVLSVTAFVGFKIDPEDAVFFAHGVFHRTDNNFYKVSFDLNNGDVFFVACLNNAGFKGFHFLAAAHYRNSGIIYHFNNVSTMFANIKFIFIHYNFLQV